MRLHRSGCRSSPRKVTLGSATRLQAPSLTPRCRYQLFAVEGHCSLGIYFVTPTQRQAAAPKSRSSLLWWSRFLLPAFFIDIYFITLTQEFSQESCGSWDFSFSEASPAYRPVRPSFAAGAARAMPFENVLPAKEPPIWPNQTGDSFCAPSGQRALSLNHLAAVNPVRHLAVPVLFPPHPHKLGPAEVAGGNACPAARLRGSGYTQLV